MAAGEPGEGRRAGGEQQRVHGQEGAGHPVGAGQALDDVDGQRQGEERAAQGEDRARTDQREVGPVPQQRPVPGGAVRRRPGVRERRHGQHHHERGGQERQRAAQDQPVVDARGVEGEHRTGQQCPAAGARFPDHPRTRVPVILRLPRPGVVGVVGDEREDRGPVDPRPHHCHQDGGHQRARPGDRQVEQEADPLQRLAARDHQPRPEPIGQPPDDDRHRQRQRRGHADQQADGGQVQVGDLEEVQQGQREIQARAHGVDRHRRQQRPPPPASPLDILVFRRPRHAMHRPGPVR